MQQHRKGGKIKQHRKAGAVVVTVGSGSGALFPGTWEQWLQGEHSAVLAVLSPTPRLCHIKAIGLQCWGWAGLGCPVWGGISYLSKGCPFWFASVFQPGVFSPDYHPLPGLDGIVFL